MDGMYFDGTNLVSLLNPPGVALFRELGCCGAKFSYRIDSLKLTASLALETRPKPQKERLVFPLPPFFQGRTVSFTDFLGGQMNCFVMFFSQGFWLHNPKFSHLKGRVGRSLDKFYRALSVLQGARWAPSRSLSPNPSETHPMYFLPKIRGLYSKTSFIWIGS